MTKVIEPCSSSRPITLLGLAPLWMWPPRNCHDCRQWIDATDAAESVLNKEEETKLKELFEVKVAGVTLQVEVKGLSPEAPPVVATRSEFMRRMKDMAAVNSGMQWYGQMPDEVTLTVNGNHPIYKNILLEENDKQQKQVHNLADLALLSQGLLKGNDLTEFISRSVELMGGEVKSKIGV